MSKVLFEMNDTVSIPKFKRNWSFTLKSSSLKRMLRMGSIALMMVTCFSIVGEVSGQVFAATPPPPNWVSVKSYPPSIGGLTSVSCPSGTATCLAVGSNSNGSTPVALSSTDGASIWISDPLPSGVTSLNSVSCFSTTGCVAVGGAGQMLH